MKAKFVLILVLAAFCSSCSMTRNYEPSERRSVKRDYLQKFATLAREGYLWEWVARPDGMQCDSLYLDGRATGYVAPMVFAMEEHLASADYEIGNHKYYRIDRYPQRTYRLKPIDPKMIGPDGTINASRPQPFIAHNAATGPLRVLRLPPGTNVFVKAIKVERIPDPEGYFLYWSAWEYVTLELTLPGEKKTVTAYAVPADFLKLVE